MRSVAPLDFDLPEEGVSGMLAGLNTEGGTGETAAETPLEVSVSSGHLKYAGFPVMVGHFLGDGIVSAEKEVDTMLGSALSDRHRLGLYPGEIGSSEVMVFSEERRGGGIVVGLGSFGTLTQSELTKTIEQGVSKYLLNANSQLSFKNAPDRERLGLSSLIIGCGYGGLSVESSVRAIIQGIQNANAKIKKLFKGGLKVIEQLEFIEIYEDRSLSCFYCLSKIVKDPSRLLNIHIPKKEIKKRYGSRKRILSQSTEGWWNRITITMAHSTDPADTMHRMEFSISTGAAREEKKDMLIDPAVIESMVYDSSTGNLWSPRLAKTLFEILIPLDFKEQLKRQDNISWILNEQTASYPWELLADDAADARPLSVNAGMIRQLGIQDYRRKINAVADNKALVVADPDLNGFLPPLTGAFKEGELVADIIEKNGFQVKSLSRDAATARNILEELHEGYKIIHLSGHGAFNKKSLRNSGMVIGKDSYLNTAYFANMSTVPELVFINCCHLGSVDGKAENNYSNLYKLAANIGTQLIRNGVKAVVAAGWAVADDAALRFAETFYHDMFNGETFGEAVRNARETVYKAFPKTNTWGAYQCYGDPYYKFRDDRRTAKPFTKEFIVAEEAEIELDNLWGKLKTGWHKEDVHSQLTAISAAVDNAGIRHAAITEKEALLYTEISDYSSALKKFQDLLKMEKADFSVSTLEKYNNIRMKKYVAEYIEAGKDNKKPDEQKRKSWQKDACTAIEDLESLLRISPTAERYSLLGSAWKRMGILYEKTGEKLDAYRRAAYYYREAFHRQGNKNAYALTNWYTLESVLSAPDCREWGNEISHQNYKYQLPAIQEARKELATIINLHRPNAGSMEYWIMMEAPNCELCALILDSDTTEQDKWDKMPDIYKEVWSKAGSKGDKFAEVEHLHLLSDALTLAGKGGTVLKGRIDTLKDKLEKMILDDPAGGHPSDG